MVSLEHSERFQKEYTEFKERIDKVDNMRVRGELDNLMQSLINEVRKLDNEHKNVISKTSIPEVVTSSRQNLLQIRQKITKYLDDYEKSVKSL